jgi:hypothetical protein
MDAHQFAERNTMYAARILRPADHTMLVLPIPLNVSPEKIEASVKRRLATVEGLVFLDVVELSDEMAAQVQQHYEQAEAQCTCGTHGPEDNGVEPGIPMLYDDGYAAMMQFLLLVLIFTRHGED